MAIRRHFGPLQFIIVRQFRVNSQITNHNGTATLSAALRHSSPGFQLSRHTRWSLNRLQSGTFFKRALKVLLVHCHCGHRIFWIVSLQIFSLTCYHSFLVRWWRHQLLGCDLSAAQFTCLVIPQIFLFGLLILCFGHILFSFGGFVHSTTQYCLFIFDDDILNVFRK